MQTMKIRNKGFFIAVWLALSLAGAAFAAAPVAQFIPNHVFVGGYDAGLATDDAAVFEFDAAGNFVRKILVQTEIFTAHR